MSNKIGKKAFSLIIVVLLEALVVSVNGVWSHFTIFRITNIPMEVIERYSFLSGIVLAFLSIYLVKEILRLSWLEQNANIHQTLLQESQGMIDVLRTHRHDFRNHLQIVLGAIQMKKLDYAVEYISYINSVLESQGSIANLKHPELAALMFKKLHYAEDNAITMHVSMESDLTGLSMSPIDLCRIIGNLVDNALHAVTELNGTDREIKVVFAEDKEAFFIEVNNRRPIIPQDIKSKVFQKDFTTKGTKGSGLGLYIVKALVESNGGKVKVTSDEKTGTLFTVAFPKGMIQGSSTNHIWLKMQNPV